MIVTPSRPRPFALASHAAPVLFRVTTRGGDERGGVLLSMADVRDHNDAAMWLRDEALRLAVRLDPGPRTSWAAPGVLHSARDPGPDAPTALRAWAEDAAHHSHARHSYARDLLAFGLPFTRRFPDVRGAWYELAAFPRSPV